MLGGSALIGRRGEVQKHTCLITSLRDVKVCRVQRMQMLD